VQTALTDTLPFTRLPIGTAHIVSAGAQLYRFGNPIFDPPTILKRQRVVTTVPA
jgi:hypothetical protein